MADYEFRYSPLTGRLTGKQMIEQTEQAINQLSSLVDSAAGQVEIISTLANEANENAATALETAKEALATTGRTYITVSTQTDANNYYDSQLIYIADSTSTNIPVADTGMLEVKTNDNKTACEQVFISDSSGDAYYRNGAITAKTVGDVTTYTVTWSGWSSQPASQSYVQGELTNYLPLSGGTLTGVVNGVTPTAGDNSTKIATTEFVNAKAGNYLPLSGGTMTGVLTNNGSTSIPINIKTTGTDYRDIQIESSDGNHRIAAIRASKTSEGRCEIMIGASTTSNAAPEGITISRSTTNIYATAPTPDATDNSKKIATTAFVRTIVPAGVVLAYARGAVPTGWLLCDGSAVSRTDYAALFAVIGTTYGTGNGSTTFNLPNLVDKFVEGSATSGTEKAAGLPNITGGFRAYSYSTGDGNGAFNSSVKTPNVLMGSTNQGLNWISYTFDASRSNSIYGISTTVQPPALTMRYIIKY